MTIRFKMDGNLEISTLVYYKMRYAVVGYDQMIADNRIITIPDV